MIEIEKTWLLCRIHALRELSVLVLFVHMTFWGQIAKGADIGWLSYFENTLDITYLNDTGQVEDALQILKNHDLSAVRLRAFVNPTQASIGEVDTQGVVNAAMRANNLGMDVMITIHYSDVWADPGSQHKPASWENLSFNDLSQAIYDYTYQLMEALINAGVVPKWVQVGNETNPGFLWEDGRLNRSDGFANMDKYIALSNRGYDAIKDVSPTTKVMTHLASGNDMDFYQDYFDEFYAKGGKNDVVGFSYYPRWNGGTIQQVADNMNNVANRYNKDVMLCEIGNWEDEEAETYNLLVDAISAVESVPNNRGLGVFYWEPIAHSSINGYEQGVAIPFNSNKYRFSWTLDAFLNDAENCTPNVITPFTQVDNGILDETSTANGFEGGSVIFAPESTETDGWFWIGPNGFTSNNRIIMLDQLTEQKEGYYLVTYTPSEGCTVIHRFLLKVFEQGEIPIQNPGFEEGKLDPWLGVGNYGIDTDLVSSGIYSGWFGGGVSELSQTITGLMPNTSYQYSSYIRNASGDNGVVTTGVRGFGGDEITTLVETTGNNGNDFKLTTVNFTTDQFQTNIQIFASTTNAQTWGKIDDVRVRLSSSLSTVSSGNGSMNKIELFPNPASENLWIRSTNIGGNVHVTIYNIQGKRLIRQTYNSDQSPLYKIPLSELTSGLYFVRLTSETGQNMVKKLIVN